MLLLRQQHCHLLPPFFLHIRSLVNVKLKWVKDSILDSVVAGDRDLKAVYELKDKLANAPDSSLPIYRLNRRRTQLGLSHIRVSAFIRQYPNIFHEFPHSTGVPAFRLSQQAISLHQQELQTLHLYEPDLIQRLCKLLMLTAHTTLPLHTIDQLKWDMGLPYNYQETLIPRYPQLFKLIRLSDEQTGLKLLKWDPCLAISELQKNNGTGNGNNLAFPVKFTRGFGLKQKCLAWLEEWQQLPYTSPYAGPSSLDPRTDVSEKRIVGVFHELLHLTIWKRTDRSNVSNLRKPLQLPQKFTKVFGRHPGIFYISQKCDTQTVVLREAYDGQELVQKHPLVGIRERFGSMMRAGKLDKSRGLYKKVSNDDNDGEDHRLSEVSDGYDFASDGLIEDKCSSGRNFLSDDDIDEEIGQF